MKITKREIIASIAIISVMLTIGFMISGKINEHQIEKNAEYQKAIHIDNQEIFEYGMNTNVGNAFVYGDIEPVDTVTYDEICGEYLYIEKIEERYERHEELVTKKDSNGKEYKEKEISYDWEIEDRESKHAEQIKFLGIVFDYGKINLPAEKYIDTIKGDKVWSWKSGERVKVRFKYYGVETEHTGTIYTYLGYGTISDGTRFFKDCVIDESLEKCTSGVWNIVFWIFLVIFICGCVFGFCYLDNKWLE